MSYGVCFVNTSRSKEHRSFLRRVAMAVRSHGGMGATVAHAPVKIRPQLLQPFSISVFLERGRTRWPRALPAAHVLQQCLELCRSLCNLLEVLFLFILFKSFSRRTGLTLIFKQA